MKLIKIIALFFYKAMLIPCILAVFAFSILIFVFSQKMFYQFLYDTAINGLSELGIEPETKKEL